MHLCSSVQFTKLVDRQGPKRKRWGKTPPHWLKASLVSKQDWKKKDMKELVACKRTNMQTEGFPGSDRTQTDARSRLLACAHARASPRARGQTARQTSGLRMTKQRQNFQLDPFPPGKQTSDTPVLLVLIIITTPLYFEHTFGQMTQFQPCQINLTQTRHGSRDILIRGVVGGRGGALLSKLAYPAASKTSPETAPLEAWCDAELPAWTRRVEDGVTWVLFWFKFKSQLLTVANEPEWWKSSRLAAASGRLRAVSVVNWPRTLEVAEEETWKRTADVKVWRQTHTRRQTCKRSDSQTSS